MLNCPFCALINKQLHADVVFENKKAIAFLPLKIEAYGHVLVVPKKHFENIFDMPRAEAASYLQSVQSVSLLLKKQLGATGVNFLHASEKTAEQSVSHFHFHLIPRFENDGLEMWPLAQDMSACRKEIYLKICGGKDEHQ